ncbi:MAG: rRNA pseudouridine synthase [Alphaproteobacteria bacterium]|nr:rRNA pseudouridine synthase [Alphaproteobacteria bacterium]
MNDSPKGERIAKVMARAGICSRRDAEKWIADGRVSVNGRVLATPACVITVQDEVVVDGRKLPHKEPTRLFMYHKPAGLVTTNRDERGRETIFDKMPQGLPRVVTVGRLDINTEGLLLLTNDGELARYLELPATGWTRRYRVRAHGHVTQEKLDRLKKGVTHEGINYGPIDATFEKQQGANVWVTMSLKEGKNREVRNVMEKLGLTVNRLIRLSYGPFLLNDLPVGAAVEIKPKIMQEQIAGFFKKQTQDA